MTEPWHGYLCVSTPSGSLDPCALPWPGIYLTSSWVVCRHEHCTITARNSIQIEASKEEHTYG